MSKQIKIEGYISFMKSTKPAQMIIEDVLETGSLTLIHSGPGNSKTGLGLDMAASILTGRNWLGRFKIHTSDAYIFFISQDAPRYDLYRQSWKVFQRYFAERNAADCFLLESRFHIIDQNNIKLDSAGDVDTSALIQKIQGRLEAAVKTAKLADSLRAIGATGTDWKERLDAWSIEQGTAQAPGDDDFSYDGDPSDSALIGEPTVADGAPIVDSLPTPQVQPVISSEPVILLFWDVMLRFHDGKESQSDELVRVFEGIRKINRELKATSILYHHDNRGGDYKGDSSVIGSVDVAFQLVPGKGDDPSAPERTLSFGITKPRGIHVRPFSYRLIQENPKTSTESLRFEYLRDEHVNGEKAEKRAAKVSKIEPIEAAARRLYGKHSTVRGLHAAMKTAGFKVGKDRVGALIKEIKAERALAAGGQVEAAG